MATLQLRRAHAYGSSQYQAPPVIDFPVAASQTCVAGDLAVFSSGYVDVSGNNATDTGLLGISEQTIVTALSQGHLIPVTLFLPGYFYEFSIGGTSAQTNVGSQYGPKDDAVGAVIDVAATVATGGFLVAFFPGQIGGQFETHRFIAEGSTTVTDGATNQPYAARLGVPGDTNPRVVVVPTPDTCALTA